MPAPVERELTLSTLYRTLERRRRILYAVSVAALALSVVFCLLSPRRYVATGLLQVQKESIGGFGLESSYGGSGISDALDANITLQTEATLLQSDTLALNTIQELHLEDRKTASRSFHPLAFIAALTKHPADSGGMERRQALVGAFEKNLKVKPVGGTRLIRIEYSDPDPKIAAQVVDSLMQGLVNLAFQTRDTANAQASQWLSKRLDALREQSGQLEAKLVDLQERAGVYSTGEVDAQGQDQSYSGVADRLRLATTALGRAEENRILREAIAKAAEKGDAEQLSSLAGNSLSDDAQPIVNSLSTLQNLRQQEAVQQAALTEAETRYGSAFPSLEQMRANLGGLRQAIANESGRLKQRAESDYEVSVRTETKIRAWQEHLKSEAAQLSNGAAELSVTREEAGRSRSLYGDLTRRLAEASVAEGLHASNLSIVDHGRASNRPTIPNIPVSLAAGLALGLLLGCGAAFLVDSLDPKIQTLEEIEELLGQGCLLGTTPPLAAKSLPRELTGALPGSASTTAPVFSEALRTLQTTLLPSGDSHLCQVVLVTSSVTGEGKTTIASHLAASLAKDGRRVLLVDMDLRNRTLSKALQLTAWPGLSDLLSGGEGETAIPQSAGKRDLHVLPAGTPIPDPSELLTEPVLRRCLSRWRGAYDCIVLDAPPVLAVADALIAVSLVDTTLLLARLGLSERLQVKRSWQLLERGSRHRMHVVVNGVQNAGEYSYNICPPPLAERPI